MATDRDDMTMRTEMPTPLRLEEARRRGQVARSADLTAAVATLAVVVALAMLGPWMLKALTAMVASMLSQAGDTVSSRGAWQTSPAPVAAVLLGGAAPALAATLAAVTAGVLQVGLLATSQPLRADLGRLSPGEGLRRMISARAWMRGFLGVVKVLAVVGVGYATIRPTLGRLSTISSHSTAGMVSATGDLLAGLALRLGAVLLVLAAGDWLYQRWQHRQDLKMTRREWLEDLKRMEGQGRLKNRPSRVASRNLGR
jgi:flagellar biosynthetic protein FlhB